MICLLDGKNVPLLMAIFIMSSEENCIVFVLESLELYFIFMLFFKCYFSHTTKTTQWIHPRTGKNKIVSEGTF